MGFGMPFIITTSIIDEDSSTKTEYFIFVVGESEIFRAMKFKLNLSEALSDKLDAVRASFSEAVLVEAETRLSLEISNYHRHKASDEQTRGSLD